MALSVPQALQLLQLEPGASRKQIRAAYKRLALQLHPDKQHQRQQQAADATAAFALLSSAYSLLLQGHKHHQHPHEHTGGVSLPPFETAYATGSLFCEQLVDEAVMWGAPPADIVTLQQLSGAAADGSLAQQLSAQPPAAADEQLWRQLYTRMQLRQQARQQLQQQQQKGDKAGVGIMDLLSDLLVKPTGPMFVDDSEDEEELSEVEEAAAAAAGSNAEHDTGAVCLQQSPQLQQPAAAAAVPQQQQQQEQQQQLCKQTPTQGQLQVQQQQQCGNQVLVRPADQHQHQAQQQPQQGRKQRHGWGFYLTWLRRLVLARAVWSVVSGGLKASLYEHRHPKPLPLPY